LLVNLNIFLQTVCEVYIHRYSPQWFHRIK